MGKVDEQIEKIMHDVNISDEAWVEKYGEVSACIVISDLFASLIKEIIGSDERIKSHKHDPDCCKCYFTMDMNQLRKEQRERAKERGIVLEEKGKI